MQLKGDYTYTGSQLRILSQHAFNKSSARNMNRNVIRGSNNKIQHLKYED
jgi:hypothetical protein